MNDQHVLILLHASRPFGRQGPATSIRPLPTAAATTTMWLR